jgi:hypothetical protein
MPSSRSLPSAVVLLGLASSAVACGTAATVSATTPDAGVDAPSTGDAGCSPAGSVPGCPCAVATPGTRVRVGQLACASGVGPAAVACGQTTTDGGVTFADAGASEWVPIFTCPGKDSCSAVTTYDEFTCKDPSTGAIEYRAILGAPCFNEDEGACSLDTSTVMECEKGVWTAFATCTSHSCVQMGDHPGCTSM